MSEDHDADPYAARLYRALRALEEYAIESWRTATGLLVFQCPMCDTRSDGSGGVPHLRFCVLGEPANVALLRDGPPRGDTP